MALNHRRRTPLGIVLTILLFAFNSQSVIAASVIEKTFYVNSYVNTGIQVRRGDTIRIAASGEVTFGLIAGSGGPEGVNWCYNAEYDEETGETDCDDYNPYSILQDSQHGGLMYRIKSPNDQNGWLFAGAGGQTVAASSGVLELNVNDNDPRNNVGKFKVDIAVYSVGGNSASPSSARSNAGTSTRVSRAAAARTAPARSAAPPAAKRGPRTAAEFYTLGLSYNNENRYSEAIDPLKSAVRLNPKHAEAHGELGYTYLKLNRCALAVDEYKAALRLKPETFATQYGLGWCYGELKRYPDALDPLRQSVRINSNYTDAHRELGFALMQTQRYPEAIEQLQLAIGQRPNEGLSHYFLGQIYLATGNKKRAQEEYKVLKKIDAAHATLFSAEMKNGVRIAEDAHPPLTTSETPTITPLQEKDNAAKKELKRIWGQIKRPN
jgi:tetratricopeptide (TPR) repeat protein